MMIMERIRKMTDESPGAGGCEGDRQSGAVRSAVAAGAALAVRAAMLALPGLLSLLPGADALATTDTTFAAPLTTVTNMVGGTGGQLAAVLAVGAALVGSVLRFNATQIMGAVGVGVAAGAGAGVVTNIVGTAIV